MERLEVVLGLQGHNAGNWVGTLVLASPILLVATLIVPSLTVFSMVVWLTLVGGAFAASSRRRLERRRMITEKLQWSEQQPFPVVGYAEWLTSEVPLFDVTTKGPVDPAFAEAVSAVDPRIGVERLDPHTVRIAIPPKKHYSLTLADRESLHELFERLLVPMHKEVGVQGVEMGGHDKQ